MRTCVFTKDEFYHIYVHGISDSKIFPSERDYQRFLALLFSANGTNNIPRLERYFGLNSVWDKGDEKNKKRKNKQKSRSCSICSLCSRFKRDDL